MKYLLFIIFLGVANYGFAEENPMTGAVLWEQSSAEYRALCYQAYNIAKIYLNKALNKKIKNPAVILDVDQTVLDHYLFAGYLAKNNKHYNGEIWSKWLMKLKSSAVAGALDFTKYAKKRGVEVFYVTNTKEKISPFTIIRMKQLGFPNADRKHFFPRTGESSKEKRRERISKTHNVIIYIGDQLTDMPGFTHKNLTVKSRYQELEKQKNKLGTEYIILPNVTYGAWAKAISYKFNKENIKAWVHKDRK